MSCMVYTNIKSFTGKDLEMGQIQQAAENEILHERKSPINWELMEQRSLDVESLKTVLPLFIENNCRQVSDLQQAWNNNDKESVESIAHTIKGSAANIGAEELSHAALLLNHGCRNGNLDNGAELVQQIKQLHEELQSYISGLE